MPTIYRLEYPIGPKKVYRVRYSSLRNLLTLSCCITTCLFAGLFGWAYHNWTQPLQTQFDVSGYGICQGRQLEILHAWVWTQHPSPIRVIPLVLSHSRSMAVLESFVGRNSIVFTTSENGTPSADGFEVESVVGNSITMASMTSRPVSTAPIACHFTLDSTSSLLLLAILGPVGVVGEVVADVVNLFLPSPLPPPPSLPPHPSPPFTYDDPWAAN